MTIMNEGERDDLRKDTLPDKCYTVCRCDINCREGVAVVSDHDDPLWGAQMTRRSRGLDAVISRGTTEKGDPDME